MSASAWDNGYESHASFYKDAYGQHVTGIHSIGSAGAFAIEAMQSAGDWSDAPTPDLCLAWIASAPVGVSCDLGAGRFAGRQRTSDAILVAPGAGGSIQVQGPHVCRVVAVPYTWFKACGGAERDKLPSDGDFGTLHRGFLHSSELSRTLQSIWREATGTTPRGRLYSDGLLLQLIGILLHMDRQSPSAASKGGLAPWQVKRVTEYIVDRLADDVCLEDLSKLLDLSTFHFCRAFKASLGEPPHRWRQQLRVERAREMLASTDLPIIEVAAAVGYDDPSRFATAYRRAFGVNPSTYRRERRR